MQRLLLIILTVLLLRASASQAQEVEKPDSSRPNFVVVLLDNIGQDWFGCCGSTEGQTPQIDSLANSGVRFRNYYVTPLCSTSRHVFLTGRYPFRTGWTIHHDSAIYGGGYLDWNREVTFARALKNAGYATAIVGKWQVNNLFDQPDALSRHGFDEHCIFPEGPRGHPAHTKRYWDPFVLTNGQRIETEGKFGPDLYVDHLIDFMRRNREKPFLAFYSAVLTHLSATTTPLDRDESRTEREKLAGMVRYADQLIGRIVQSLDQMGLRENTIVIITTDNGTPAAFGGQVEGRVFQAAADTMVEGDMLEGSINVPFVVNCPSLIPGGRVSDALIDNSDLFPSLLDLAGAKSPPDVTIDGRSFADVLLSGDDSRSAREWIYSQYASQRLVRNQRYKLRNDGRLYDLQRDPLEQNDVSDSVNPEVVAQKTRLQKVLDSLPSDTPCWFPPRSISARRLEVGDAEQRTEDAALAPDDPPSD